MKLKVLVTLNVIGDESDEEALRDSIKEAMVNAVEADDAGEKEINYSIEEEEDE